MDEDISLIEPLGTCAICLRPFAARESFPNGRVVDVCLFDERHNIVRQESSSSAATSAPYRKLAVVECGGIEDLGKELKTCLKVLQIPIGIKVRVSIEAQVAMLEGRGNGRH